MRLPAWLHPLLVWARHVVASLQRPPAPVAPEPFASPAARGLDRLRLRQPDGSSCGSAVIVMDRMLRDEGYAASLLAADDPEAEFGVRALGVRRRTNGWRNGRPQLPWPEALGTRPAALARELGGLVTRVVDPRAPGAAYDAILAAREPTVLYIGEGSWMQHIVLVTGAGPEWLRIYDPAVGTEVVRSREQFETARLGVAGWDQPWLVMLRRGPARHTRA